MRIIQVMPEFGLAGAEIMCEELSKSLKKMGHDIYIISMYNYHSPITERLEKEGIKIFYLDKKPGIDISIITKMRNIFQNIKPEVVHTHRYVMKYVLPAAKLCGVRRIVHTVHSVAQKENFKRDRIVYHIGYRLFNVIPVGLSEEIKQTIMQVYRLKSEKIPVIFNGIDLEKYDRKTNYSTAQKFSILHVGRFAEAKNHVMIIEAVEQLVKLGYDISLKLIGEGPLENKIRELVEQKELQNAVIFVGVTDKINQYMNECDLFILPSIYEGMPMTLLEAMASALPIVSTNVGGIPTVLRDGENALLSEPKTSQIVENIVKMIKSEEKRKEYGENAYKDSTKYSVINMTEQYLEIYHS